MTSPPYKLSGMTTLLPNSAPAQTKFDSVSFISTQHCKFLNLHPPFAGKIDLEFCR